LVFLIAAIGTAAQFYKGGVSNVVVLESASEIVKVMNRVELPAPDSGMLREGRRSLEKIAPILRHKMSFRSESKHIVMR
jgi:hypothetical protein